MKEKEKIQLTTQAGVPVADNQNILTAGERGPALLQNVIDWQNFMILPLMHCFIRKIQ